MHTLKIPRVLLELTLYEPLGQVSGMCHSLVSVIQHIIRFYVALAQSSFFHYFHLIR